VSLQIHKFAGVNQTAATPILAFLIALDPLLFIEIAAGMVER
jgi:hypothetical protein